MKVNLMRSFLLLITIGCLVAFVAPQGYQVGDVASDFSLKNVDGKTISLANFKNVKGYIVIFTCNHCPYAKFYEDRIIALDAKYKKDYPVIAINPNDPSIEPEDSEAEMINRAKQKAYKFPYLFDKGQKVFPLYGATKTPHVYLLDKNRVVKYIGAIDDNPQEASSVKVKYLENAIQALNEGKTITPSVTKALGCSIKVKK